MIETENRKPLPRLTNGDLGIKPYMIDVMQLRHDAIMANPSLIESNPWPTTKAYYNLRKIDHLGYNIDEVYPPGHKLAGKVILAERRPYIQGKMLTDICEKDFDMKRHELGIFVDERTQFVYRGVSSSVGFYDIDNLTNKGTDILLCEKAYAVKSLKPFFEDYGMALLECGGNFVEYAKVLCQKASDRGCNAALLTDFDISGIAMCINIPWATRIGIDAQTISSLGLTDEERRDVQERYNADPNQMKFVTETLDKYAKYGWVDGPVDLEDGGKGGNYNLELIRSLMLDQRQAIKYLAGTRIELDHVIDVVGPARFFQYVKETMEDRFEDRDYNYAVDRVTIDEIIPVEIKEFNARLRKFITHLPKIQPTYSNLLNNLKYIEGIQPVDKEHDKIVNKLTKVATKANEYKQLVSELRKATRNFELPELSDEEKRNL